MRNVLQAVGEPEEFGRFVTLGLDPDRAVTSCSMSERVRSNLPAPKEWGESRCHSGGQPGRIGPEPEIRTNRSIGRPVSASVTVPCTRCGRCRVSVRSSDPPGTMRGHDLPERRLDDIEHVAAGGRRLEPDEPAVGVGLGLPVQSGVAEFRG